MQVEATKGFTNSYKSTINTAEMFTNALEVSDAERGGAGTCLLLGPYVHLFP